jgi:hypothetical protein
MKIGQKIVITGIIMPHNWDDDGRIVDIAIYTNKEEIYAMEHNTITQELWDLMQKRVEIRGEIREHPDGKKLIAAQYSIVLDETVDDSG